MKKSILSLLTGAICLAGVTSANAAWTQAQESAIGTIVATTSEPLMANTYGVALNYSTAKGLYFTDNYQSANSYTRRYTFVVYSGVGNYFYDGTGAWQYKVGGSVVSPFQSFVLQQENSKGGEKVIPATEFATYLDKAFAEKYSAHVELGTLLYWYSSSAYIEPSLPASFGKTNGLGAMYHIDFYKPPKPEIYVCKLNRGGTNTSYTYANKYTGDLQSGDKVTFCTRTTGGWGSQSLKYYLQDSYWENGTEVVHYPGRDADWTAYTDANKNVALSGNVATDNEFVTMTIGPTTTSVGAKVTAKAYFSQSMGRTLSDTAVSTYWNSSVEKVKILHPFNISATTGGKVTVTDGNSASAATKGTTTPINAKGQLGYMTEVTAEANAGYHFVGWKRPNGNYLTNAGAKLAINFRQDTTLTAVFELNQNKISLSAATSTTTPGSSSCNLSYTSHLSCYLTATVTANSSTITKFFVYSKAANATSWQKHNSYTMGNITATPDKEIAFGSVKDSVDGKDYVKIGVNKYELFSGVPNASYTEVRLGLFISSGDTLFSAPVKINWYFPVTFKDKDGGAIINRSYAYNAAVTVPTKAQAKIPENAGGIVYSYYWEAADGSQLPESKTTVSATNVLSYKAVLVTKYNVTFYDWDNTILKDAQAYAPGASSVTKPADPTREGYSFDGWYKKGDATKTKVTNFSVTSPVDYVALYKIKASFVSEGKILRSGVVYEGEKFTPPTDPTKDGYTFVGWYVEGDADETIVTDFTVTEPVTYVARFAKNPEFQLAFEGFAGHGKAGDAKLTSENPCIKVEEPVINLNGETVYKSDVFENGSEYAVAAIVIASVDGECAEDDLVKEVAEAYEFSEKSVPVSVTVDGEKWIVDELYNVDGVYAFNTKATVTPATRYLVEFMSTDGEGATVISSALYADGAEIIMPTEEELKNVVVPAADDEFGYAFNNKWSPEVAATVTADVQYVPVIDKSSQTYVVTFHVGEETSESAPVKYGESVTLPAIPSKEGFLFMGWNTVEGKKSGFYNSEAIKGNTDLYAVFTEIPEVKFVATDMIEGNDFITITSPSKCFVVENEVIAGVNSKNPMAAGKEYTWTAALTSDEENCSEDDELLVALGYAYMAILSNNLKVEIPVMVNDQVAAKNIMAVLSGEANTITYKFTAAAIDLYTITFLQADGKTEISSDKIKGGEKIVAPAADKVTAPMDDAQYKYVFKGWDPALADDATATEDASYTAQFEKVLQTYSVKFLADGKQVGETQTVSYGKAATAPKDPTKEGYKFTKWDTEDYKNVKGDVEVNAVFEKITSSSSSKVEDKSSSSSKPASSSSKVEDKSSSSAKPASSSSKTEDKSSSSAKPASSSSKTEAIFAAAQAPKFSLSVAGRNVQIAGARVGSAYAILDMQGRVMTTGSVESANFSVALPRSGSYMVRVGSQAQRVNVR